MCDGESKFSGQAVAGLPGRDQTVAWVTEVVIKIIQEVGGDIGAAAAVATMAAGVLSRKVGVPLGIAVAGLGVGQSELFDVVDAEVGSRLGDVVDGLIAEVVKVATDHAAKA